MSAPGTLVLLRTRRIPPGRPIILFPCPVCNPMLTRTKTTACGSLTGSARTEPLAAGGTGAIVSHWSGETDDTFVADLAVGSGCGQLNSGAPARGERVQIQPANGNHRRRPVPALRADRAYPIDATLHDRSAHE